MNRCQEDIIETDLLTAQSSAFPEHAGTKQKIKAYNQTKTPSKTNPYLLVYRAKMFTNKSEMHIVIRVMNLLLVVQYKSLTTTWSHLKSDTRIPAKTEARTFAQFCFMQLTLSKKEEKSGGNQLDVPVRTTTEQMFITFKVVILESLYLYYEGSLEISNFFTKLKTN